MVSKIYKNNLFIKSEFDYIEKASLKKFFNFIMLLSYLIIRIFIINIYKDVKLKKDKNEIRTISRKK